MAADPNEFQWAFYMEVRHRITTVLLAAIGFGLLSLSVGSGAVQVSGWTSLFIALVLNLLALNSYMAAVDIHSEMLAARRVRDGIKSTR